MTKRSALVYLACAIFMLTASHTIADEGLKLSQRAPAFILKTLDGGKVVKSRDIFSEKKLTVLIFWDSYCPDCLKAVADCKEFHQYSLEKKLDVNVWSVNFDDEKLPTARSFVKGEEITFPILSDTRGVAVSRYKAKAYDFSFFIVDNKGIIQYICYDHPPNVADVIKEIVEKLLKERLKASTPAPVFALKTLDGNKLIRSEEAFTQKELTVLIFWNIRCKESLDAIVECQKLYESMKKLGIGFLSVNFDNKNDKILSFAGKSGLKFPILSDTDKSVAKSYKGEDCCFSMFIIDKNGIIGYASYRIPEKIGEIEDQVKKLRSNDEKM